MAIALPPKPIYVLSTFDLRDRPCFGLYELNYQSPGNKGFHRYQIILIPDASNNTIQEYRKDLGRAKKFKGIDQFRIPGGVIDEVTKRIFIEHKVGELLDIADRLRTKGRWDKKALAGVNRVNE